MKANPSTEMGDGLLSLCWNNHRSTFCHVISTLREKERFSDVTLACEGRYYPVHKLVLSVCSDYFDSMLERTPCKHPVIVLRDVQPDDLEALLSYMYEGIVSVAQNDLARLIKTAEMLRIKGLAVPDDPVPSASETRRQSISGNSQSPSRSGRESRESRSSPSAKRRRREENGSNRETSHGHSNNDSTDISSLSPHDTYDTSSNRSRTNTRDSSHIETKQEVMHSQDIEEVIVSETLVKQEIEESDSIQKGDSSLLGGYNVGDSSQMVSHQSDHSVLSHRYDSSGADQQHNQPLEEAVAEALAGPSGMQTWLGGGELNSSSFTTVDAYNADSGDVGSQQLGQQQMMLFPINKKYLEVHRSRKSVTCSICGYQSNNKKNLNTHIKLHINTNSYKCKHCSYLSLSRHILAVHERTHTEEKPFRCNYCSMCFKQKGGFTQHVLQTHLYCEVCKISFKSNIVQREHMKSHVRACLKKEVVKEEEPGNLDDENEEGKLEIVENSVEINVEVDQENLKTADEELNLEMNMIDEAVLASMDIPILNLSGKMHKCGQCHYSSDRRSRLTRHLKSHEKSRTLRCQFCEFECLSLNVMAEHERKHDNVQFYSCSRVSCNFKCNTRSNLIRHESRHSGVKNFHCPRCPYAAVSKYVLSRHMKASHSTSLDFFCDSCEFKSSRRIDLRRHQISEHGGKSKKTMFRCSFCPYKAMQRSNIKQHERRHTGEKPYHCPICSYKGTQLSNLQYHMKSHADASAYHCQFCPYAAISAKTLERHQQEHILQNGHLVASMGPIHPEDPVYPIVDEGHGEEEEAEDNAVYPMEMVDVETEEIDVETEEIELDDSEEINFDPLINVDVGIIVKDEIIDDNEFNGEMVE